MYLKNMSRQNELEHKFCFTLHSLEREELAEKEYVAIKLLYTTRHSENS